jgi:hypothetical protein
MKFPQAYALFLKDLSRLIKPTTTSVDLSMDLIWELMLDIDEYQKYSSQQSNVQLINNMIPDIWGEIGKRFFFLSIEDKGYVQYFSHD